MKERSRGFLIAGIISLMILGFGLLSISESFAGELSKGEMDMVRGGQCAGFCIINVTTCESYYRNCNPGDPCLACPSTRWNKHCPNIPLSFT